MAAASTKELMPAPQKPAATMKNAVRMDVQEWIAARTKIVAKPAQWNVARTANALKRGMMVKTAAKRKV
jgi:hypothetical protein